MSKVGFVGFGEVNTPVEVIVSRAGAAAEALEKEGLAPVLCVAGWILTHAVIKISKHFRHLPVVLWSLCGWMEDGVSDYVPG